MRKWIDGYKRAVSSAQATLPPNGNTSGYAAKTSADDPDYIKRVAQPVMNAVDTMPAEWRALVHEYGYVDVYRAWRRGLPPTQVRASAEGNNGVFVLARTLT